VSTRSKRWTWKRWLVIGMIALGVAVVGGPFLYIHVVQGEAPAPLSLASPSSGMANTTSTNGTSGTWKVARGSVVGYRVKEVLFGQSNVAVGRTSRLSGSMVVDGSTISKATVTVDMASVTSNESRRDEQFNGRIMETATYPTATFALTRAIDFGSVPKAGAQRTLRITGTLTLHGATRTVTFTATGRYTGSAVQVAGSIPIRFADYGISNPSFGPVTTEDHGVLEFSLTLTRP